ncbi:MAG: cyclic nucleotide-binding domain-containing protein [Candidatus Marinimicrobia bacterium]|nr:cyclic nucleotide-binding domain-containing protein [Candidatus Neomarinimicrobiota bacterium]
MTFLEKKSAREFEEGEIIFKEHDPGSSMFIIQSGAVEVSSIKNNQKVVYAHLKTGAIFGEMALIDGQPRSATVTSLRKTRCIEMSRMLFQKHLDGLPPWMTSFFQILAERLREANKKADTLNTHDNSRQIIMMVSSILSNIEPNALDEVITPWKPLANDISILLNLPTKQVDQVLNKITLTPMAKSEMSYEKGRILVMRDLNQFKFFADYCRSRFIEKQGNEVALEFRKMDQKEADVISFLHKIMREQRWEPEIEQHLFEERFNEVHELSLTDYKRELKQFRDSDLISSKLDKDDVKMYVVNKEKLQTLNSMNETIAEFEQMDSKL